MVKHSQTVRRHQPVSCLSVFDHSVGLVLKELKVRYTKINIVTTRKFYIRSNNNKVNSSETRRIVITDLLP